MFQIVNPFNLRTIEEHKEYSSEEIRQVLSNAEKAFRNWRNTSFEKRAELMKSLAVVIHTRKEEYARLITREMGKPIRQSVAELEKCAWACEYYAENAKGFLKDEHVETDASESWVSYEPLGPILAVMPWNFPYWQVFRFLAPALMAGNVGLLKHSHNVIGCALSIEEMILEAGFPPGVFQNLIISSDKVPEVIENPIIRAVTLTGSEKAGSSVASLAGKNIKKTVLELGGSNSFIVLDDANLDEAVKVGVMARMQNTGQSCIAAKRFLVQRGIAQQYINQFVEEVKTFKYGDPLDEETTIGPLARVDLAEKLAVQVQESIDQGAKLLIGGSRDGAYFEPTVLTEVEPGMPAFDEETFGPVAAFTVVDDLDHAIRLSNQSTFGLGVTIFTEDLEQVRNYIHQVQDGSVFINGMVKSDPRLPFGGTKRSGYGRELSRHGILEFVNVKTVYIR